jgi:hypothetical protein
MIKLARAEAYFALQQFQHKLLPFASPGCAIHC